MALELPVYDYSVPAPGADGPWSFATLWPLRPVGETRHQHLKFCALLEGLVACGDWHGWILFKARPERADHFLDLPQRTCCCCAREAVYACTREAHLGYCEIHGPAQGATSLESKGKWIIVWQTRAPSSVLRQKTELRKLWQAARWCPETALDFEPMFDKSVLADAQQALGSLNALTCMRLGLVHLSEEPTAHVQHSRRGREEDLLCLADLGPIACPDEGPVARVIHKYAELLEAFPGLKDAPLRDLEVAYGLYEELRRRVPRILNGECAELRAPELAPCAHVCVQLEPPFSCCCGAKATASCALCSSSLCGQCARQPLAWERIVLELWEAHKRGDALEELPAPRRFCDLMTQGRLCSSSPRLCPNCAQVTRCADASDLCVQCAAGARATAHNLWVLECLVAKHVRLAEDRSAQSSASAALSAEVAPSAPARPRIRAEVRGFLFPPSVLWLSVECKQITSSAAHKAWLEKLVLASLELHGATLLRERLQRLEIMEATHGQTAGRGALSGARAEFVRVILDVLCLLRIQGAWACEANCAFLGEVAFVCLERILPEAFAALAADARKHLVALCKDMAGGFFASRESWWRYECPEQGCQQRPRATALFRAWRDAPIGAPSRLPFAFACGHAAKRCAFSDALRCLNCMAAGDGVPAPLAPESLTSKLTDGAERTLTMSRCPKCRFPISFGRTVFSLADLVRLSLRRERAALLRASFLPRGDVSLAHSKGTDDFE
jgi:hypothetical protein